MKHRVWHLRGGIHPPEKKSLSLGVSLRKAPLPNQLVVPLGQHIGLPASPCVKVGEHVLKGQVIAHSGKASGAVVHAPSSGRIREVGLHPVIHPSHIDQSCIQIDCDGKDEWIEHQGTEDASNLNSSEILKRIQSAGIIGMGGAGFPSHIKLLPPKNTVDTLIINGAECEPYITADDILMQECAAEIVKGIEIIGNILQPKEILIGIEDNKPLAISALEQATSESSIDIVKIPTKYPSGGEKQLIKILTGKEVPTGGLPLHVGVIVQNIGTVYSIYKAIAQGEPCISRITTLTGDALQSPGNIETLIGTQVKHLLDEADVQRNQLFRIVAGGPMMGFSIPSEDLPISKTTNCLIGATRAEMPPPPPEQTCIRCGQCADICPVTLLPQQLYFFSKSQEFDKAEQHNLSDCIECGACSFVCPSHIPLVQYYRYAKGTIKQLRIKEEKAEASRLRFENRQERLELEAAKKQEKRNARAKAAAEKAKLKAVKPPPTKTDTIALLKTAAATASKLAAEANKALLQTEKKEGHSNKNLLEELRQQVEVLEKKAIDAKQALNVASAPLPPTNPTQNKQSVQNPDNPCETPSAQPPSPSTGHSNKVAEALTRNALRKAQKALEQALAQNESDERIAILKVAVIEASTQCKEQPVTPSDKDK
ncbi:MAG: electron transport complex subunit RsxC [Gammaproteobacteria bacterium]|nr:electron transport complex subunit RsxC [Gammaproteobacteria bacterium]